MPRKSNIGRRTRTAKLQKLRRQRQKLNAATNTQTFYNNNTVSSSDLPFCNGYNNDFLSNNTFSDNLEGSSVVSPNNKATKTANGHSCNNTSPKSDNSLSNPFSINYISPDKISSLFSYNLSKIDIPLTIDTSYNNSLSINSISSCSNTPKSGITEVEVTVDPTLYFCDESSSDNVSAYPIDQPPESQSQVQNDKLKTENSIKLTNNPKRRLIVKEIKPYQCTFSGCPRGFNSEISLNNHLWNHSSQIARKVLSTSDINAKRSSLRKSSSTLDSSTHSSLDKCIDNSDDQDLKCPVCGKISSTKGNLKAHVDTHQPKGNYKCDICSRIFKTQSNLIRHQEYHEEVQYKCQICNRVYPTNSTLRAHSVSHSTQRPYKCPSCDKTFKRNQDLKFHVNQHTGERPYQCPYCPKAFASSGNCFSHRKRMHPDEVERDKEILE